MTATANAARLEHGWLLPDGRYVCDGCTARAPHEHRCFGEDGDRPCECETCTVTCARCTEKTPGHAASDDGWLFTMEGDEPVALCPACAARADS